MAFKKKNMRSSAQQVGKNTETEKDTTNKAKHTSADASNQSTDPAKPESCDQALLDAKATSPLVTASDEENHSPEAGTSRLVRPSIHSNRRTDEAEKNDPKEERGAPRPAAGEQDRPLPTGVAQSEPSLLSAEIVLESSTAGSSMAAPMHCCPRSLLDAPRFIVAAIGIIVLAALLHRVLPALLYKVPIPPEPTVDYRTNDLRSQLESLFPNQAKRFYVNVISVVRGVQMESPQPSSLLLMSNGSPDDKKVVDSMAECLANLLEHNLTGKAQATIVRGENHKGIEHDQSKYLIDEQLEEHFSKQARVALVTGIESLSLDAAKVFYKYCDHENSQHNNVIFVLTVTVHGANVTTADLGIERELLASWSSNPDEVSPILTRVANNVLPLKPDQQFKCQDV